VRFSDALIKCGMDKDSIGLQQITEAIRGP